jgi:hypothetical protein
VATPLFSVIPVDPADFMAFRPLGFMSPPIHVFPAKHAAFSMTPLGQTPVPKPVRAPSDLWVMEIWAVTSSTGGANYQIFAYPCRDVRLYFGHIASLSDKLRVAMQSQAPRCNSFNDGSATMTTCRHENLNLALTAGETMAMGPDTAGVDFGLIDFRRAPAPFIKPEHYDYYYPYYASPLEYFAPQAQSALAAKTGQVFGARPRTAAPVGGTYMQDVAGTAQGNWFFPGVYHRTSTDLSPSLALASDYVDPAQPIFSVGNSIAGLTMGQYAFTPESIGTINRPFAEVRADGQTYCYDAFLQGQTPGGLGLSTPAGIVLLALPSDTTLKIELVAGSSCSTSSPTFGNGATLFER